MVQISGALRGIEDGILSISEAFPTSKEAPKNNTLNDLAAKKEAPAPTEEKPADPFLKLKIELRKMGVNPEEAKAFIEAKEIQPEAVEAWIKDTAALKDEYENYVIDKEATEAFGKAS